MVFHLLSDLLARLRNASNLKLKEINVLNSKHCLNILLFLYELGFLAGFKVLNIKLIKVFLRYSFNLSSFRYIRLLSKPTKPLYLKVNFLKNKNLYKLNYNSFIILSTNKGLLTLEMACFLNCGGKLLFEIF